MIRIDKLRCERTGRRNTRLLSADSFTPIFLHRTTQFLFTEIYTLEEILISLGKSKPRSAGVTGYAAVMSQDDEPYLIVRGQGSAATSVEIWLEAATAALQVLNAPSNIVLHIPSGEFLDTFHDLHYFCATLAVPRGPQHA